MKIAVTGTHRVGKTTLVEELLESLPDYEYIQEPYYELEESGYLFPEIPTVDDYIAQLEYSITQISKNDGNVIFDRCPVDLLAYIEAIGGYNTQSLYSKAKDAMKEIDLLVFVPIENPDILVYTEPDLSELRFLVNDILNDWVWDFDIETVEVNGTPSNRCKQIIDRLLQSKKQQ